ncbi:MAG: ferritin-like domain-containing protein [Myxococcota bacterium]|nr:ferritin-like domain-containing protein [Myxococcales bacterium]
MDKILAAHRHQLGAFEVVDVVDEGAIARVREHVDVDVPLTLHWTWSYAPEVEELRRLYEKGKAGQWNAETDVDWDARVSADDWIMNPEASALAQLCKMMGKDEATQKAAAFDEVAYTISQLLHGEQAALQLCGQLTNLCEDIDQKLYAASQVVDEARHIEVLSKFLQRKMGTLYPIGTTLKTLLDILLEAKGVSYKVLGMQTLFEGMAVGIMDMIRRESRCALFSDILLRVEGDEARHAAFGVLNMRRIVRDASTQEMHQMEDWAFGILETLNANQQLDMLRLLAPKYDLQPELIVEGFTKLPDFAQLNSPPFMHTVVPNLLRLGLITERTQEHWMRLGMMTDAKGTAQSVLPIAG